MKKKILSVLLATVIIGGVGAGGSAVYARYMNRATGQAGITRVVRHGISMDMAVTNPYNDNVILPGDEYPFKIWIENTANYTQDVKFTLTPDFCGLEGINYDKVTVEVNAGHDGQFHTVGNMTPGERREIIGKIIVSEDATNKDIPDNNGETKSYALKLGAEVIGTQTDRP